MERELAKNKLKELVEQFQSASKNRDYVNEQNEEWVKWNYIEPLLEILGWKRGDIEKEYRVLKGRADYLLKIGNAEVLVVEAKKVGVPLSEEEGRQAVSYAYHRKIRFAVLTNFKEVRVYHALSNIRNIDRNLLKFDSGGYFRFTFDQFLDNFEKLSLLSRENIERKEIDKLLSKKDEKAARLIDESILDDLLEIREWLSKDLKKLRAHLTKEQIDEIVQILIDRLIFMRSVEDRGLEERDFLLKMVKDFQEGRNDKRLWESLKIKFKIFDKEYNSKIFAEGLLEKEGFFDEQTLTKVIKELYFGNEGQQERYMFDEIPGDLLGTIYEQYLGTILAGTEKRVKLDAASGKRKKMGIFYTPAYIVDYIVKNTVYDYIKDKSIDEILEINLVDPACGSGSFLIKAFECVCEVIEEKLKKGEKSKVLTFQSYNERLSLPQKATILTSCIYGVDLDEKAIELAQLNLLLKLLEDETAETRKRILPNMQGNIKCGNSLIDDSAVAGDKAFKWEAQFPEAFRKGGFDVVIGNPPYVFARSNKFTDKEKELYYKKYHLSQYQLNTYLLFSELAINLLRPAGHFGFIIPNTWQTIDNFSKFRKYIFGEMEKIKVVNCEDKVFGDANVDTSILLFSKTKNNNSKVQLLSLKNSIFDVSFEGSSNSLGENYILRFDSGDKEEISRILSKVEEKSIHLNELSTVKAGLKAYETGKGTPKQTDEMKKSRIYHTPVQKDKSYYRYLEGKDVRRYCINWGGSYLKYGGCLAAPRIFELFSEERILVRQIPSKPPYSINAVFTNEVYLNDINSMIIYKFKDYDPRYILGLLNSKLISFWFNMKFNKLQRGLFPQFKVKELEIFPIASSKENASKIIRLVDEIISARQKNNSLKSSGSEKERVEQTIINLNYEIDQEVYKLYGITKEEQKIIEESST